MRIACYVPGCWHTIRLSLFAYLRAVWLTRSWKPYVCADHYDLFSGVEHL